MSNILITGSSGFVGKNFLKHIYNTSDVYFLVVRKKDNLEDFEKYTNINFIFTFNLFLESLEWWKGVTKNVDIIIHAAWYMNKIDNLNSNKNIECLLGTINLANAAKINNVDKFLAIGSCLEYSKSDLPLTIESLTNPITLYGVSKLSTFLFLNQIFYNSSTTFSWCRLFYLYGPGENTDRLYPYVNRCILERKNVKINNPDSVRDYMHINDAVDKMVEILNSKKSGLFNICSGTPILIKDFVLKLIKSSKSKLILNKHCKDTCDIIVGVPNI